MSDGSPSLWFDACVWYSVTKTSWFSGWARKRRNAPARSFCSEYSVIESAISGPPAPIFGYAAPSSIGMKNVLTSSPKFSIMLLFSQLPTM